MKVKMLISMNNEMYPDDHQKIIFALSFMREGTEKHWKASFWQYSMNLGNLGTWNDFKTALRTSFSVVDKEGNALNKMMTERMTGTTDKYVEQFKIWAADSGVRQDGPLIEWFHQGLPAPLRNRILNTDNEPTTIGEWYAYASKFNNQWRCANTISKRLKGVQEKKGLKFKNSGFKFTPKDPNAMDMDRLQ